MSCDQALAVWQWWRYCGDQLPAGKAFLRINLDETSVCLFQGGGKGTVFVKKSEGKKPKQKVSRGKRRCCLTHVGLICDRSELQPVLPQVVIGNEATFPAKELEALKASSPANVHLLRQKSAWNNIDTLVNIIELLAAALEPHTGELQPVLFLDACKIHLSSRVVAACNAAHIWLVVVPAQMTWLLQPLDTHCFFQYKRQLKESYQAARCEPGCGDIAIHRFLLCLYHVIRYVMQAHKWSVAFDEDGFGADPDRCRPCIKRELGIEAPIAVPSHCPTDEQFQMCFPRRTKFSISDYLRPFFIGPAMPPRALAAPKASPLQAALAGFVIGPVDGPRQLRSHKRKADEAMAHTSGAAAPSRARPQAVTPRGARLLYRKPL